MGYNAFGNIPNEELNKGYHELIPVKHNGEILKNIEEYQQGRFSSYFISDNKQKVLASGFSNHRHGLGTGSVENVNNELVPVKKFPFGKVKRFKARGYTGTIAESGHIFVQTEAGDWYFIGSNHLNQ